jgi:hypothetical protein
MGDSNVDGDGGEVDGDGSGGNGVDGDGSGIETSVPPKFVGGNGGALELFLEKYRLI